MKGQDAILSATIDDTRYSGGESTQSIVAAEYYIDVPPWVSSTTPVSFAMSALDGGFDEPNEPVMASINTTDMTPGRHILFVRGLDADGNWGPFTAIFLVIEDYQVYLPIIVK